MDFIKVEMKIYVEQNTYNHEKINIFLMIIPV